MSSNSKIGERPSTAAILRITRAQGLLLGALVVLIATCYTVVVAAGFRFPLGYDESYNLQVPWYLAHSHQYATDGSLYTDHGVREFDALISTGPTVLLPIGLAYMFFGDNLWVARALMSAWFVALAIASFVLGRQVGGRWAGCAAVMALLAVNTRAEWPAGSGWPNGYVAGPGDVLGEVPAAALLMWAALAMSSHRWRTSGTLLGLAVLTKVLTAIVLPAFLLAAFVSVVALPIRQRLSRLAVFTGWLAAPLVGWQAIRLAWLGPDRYGQRVVDFMDNMVALGSGLAPDRFSIWDVRAMLLVHSTHIPAITGCLALAGFALLLSGRERPVANHSPNTRSATIALCGAAVTILVWWLVISDTVVYRHVVIAVLLAVPVGASWLVREAASRDTTHWIAVVATCALGAQAVSHASTAFETPQALDSQVRASHFLAEKYPSEVRFVGWWMNPELRVLGGVRPVPLKDKAGLLVIGPMQQNRQDPALLAQTLDLCDRSPRRVNGYVLCWVDRPVDGPNG